jgi:2-polyprenyl-3-methyl-5-hydroxy-6-metoxy-1,4-benzoquinol methylase
MIRFEDSDSRSIRQAAPSLVGPCPICQSDQPRKVAEEFQGGTFFQCSGCGVHYAATVDYDLRQYYREIWSEGNLGYLGYEEKVKAASDPNQLERLIREIPRYSWVVAQLRQLTPGSKVLDVGCGEGGLLWAAQQLKLEAHGCDLSPGAVTLARQLVGDEQVHLGTVLELPYEARTFDCVLALEVLEHLPSPRPFLERLTWLLKPGGVLLLTTPNRNRLFAVLKRGLGRPHSNTDYPPHHYTRWTNGVIKKILESDFEDIHVGSLRYHFHHPVGRFLSFPIHAATLGKMGQSLCVKARRLKHP